MEEREGATPKERPRRLKTVNKIAKVTTVGGVAAEGYYMAHAVAADVSRYESFPFPEQEHREGRRSLDVGPDA